MDQASGIRGLAVGCAHRKSGRNESSVRKRKNIEENREIFFMRQDLKTVVMHANDKI